MLNNFVGEFLVLQGTAIANFTWTVWASLGVILSACYMLWMYQRVFYGETGPEVRSHIWDLRPREWAAVLPLIVMMVWMGVYSQSFLAPVSRNTARVLEQTNVNVPYRVQQWDRPPGLGGADTRVCRVETHLDASSRWALSVGKSADAADTSVCATAEVARAR